MEVSTVLYFSEQYDAFGRFHLTIVTTFIFTRNILFMMVCANVNHYAYEPLQNLRNVPEGCLCEDVRIFYNFKLKFFNIFFSVF